MSPWLALGVLIVVVGMGIRLGIRYQVWGRRGPCPRFKENPRSTLRGFCVCGYNRQAHFLRGINKG